MTFPTFQEFFQLAKKNPPFPWQSELARRACEGDWPSAVEIPTGLGKTTAIHAAVYAAAFQQHQVKTSARPRRTTPQRIIYVVGRRSVVDQTHHGLADKRPEEPTGAGHDDFVSLNTALEQTTLGPMADALKQLAGPWGEALQVERIHGEARDQRGWLRPTGVCIVSMTPHQLVSRLLFRGFGVYPRTRPIHAGLLGVDALILFDEPHLNHQAVETVRSVLKIQAGAAGDLGVPSSRIVLLGATIHEEQTQVEGGSGASEAISLTDADYKTPAVRRLLTAKRPLTLVRADASDAGVRKALLAQHQDQRARFGAGRRIAIMVNTVAMAQAVFREVSQVEPNAILMTSLLRGTDRFNAMKGAVAATSNSDSGGADVARTIVATQCLEVGVDWTFDSVITEACPYPSLRQRIGRANRDGKSVAPECAIVVGKEPSKIRKGTVAVYGAECVTATTELLIARSSDDVVDMSLGAWIPANDDRSNDDAVYLDKKVWPETPRLATFHDGYLDVMANSYPTPWSDLPVSAFIESPDRPDTLDVLVCWREVLSPKVLEVCRPSSAEQISVPLPALRAMLRGDPAVEVSDDGDLVTPGPTRATGKPRTVMVRRDSSWGEVPLNQLRPGDVVVLASERGGYDDRLGWVPSSTAPVPDHSLVTRLQQKSRGRVAFPLSRQTLESVPMRAELSKPELDKLFGRMDKVLGSLDIVEADEIREALLPVVTTWESPYDEVVLAEWTFEVVGPSLIAWIPSKGTWSTGGNEQSLDEHQEQVQSVARGACEAAGVAEGVAESVQRAARWHDQGKEDSRFQRYLGNFSESVPWAKSRRGRFSAELDRRYAEQAGKPPGWRHEARSASLAATQGLSNLEVHLVGAHHGRFRPLFGAPGRIGDDQLLDHATEFNKLNRRWGPWGLAYLEALVRLSDWYASAHPTQGESPKAPSSTGDSGDAARVPSSSLKSEPAEVVFAGLLPTPLTGWYAIAGLLRIAAEAGDDTAAVRWPRVGAGVGAPVWRSELDLLALGRLLLASEQWGRLNKLGEDLATAKADPDASSKRQDRGFAVKNQGVGPARVLGPLLEKAADAWLVRGILQDANRADETLRIRLGVPAQPNNASFVSTAVGMLGVMQAEDFVAALRDPLKGWVKLPCDGGMDRAGVDDGVTGREVKNHRMIRAHLAPAALLGMASMGTVGVGGLGVRGRQLRLPLPAEFVSWRELMAHTNAAGQSRDWRLEYEIRNVEYERLWIGRAVGPESAK